MRVKYNIILETRPSQFRRGCLWVEVNCMLYEPADDYFDTIRYSTSEILELETAKELELLLGSITYAQMAGRNRQWQIRPAKEEDVPSVVWLAQV